MKNIQEKIDTLRTATAFSRLTFALETSVKLKANDLPKKDVIPIARAAAVMAAKKTSDLIPYCHPLPIDGVDVEIEIFDTHLDIHVSVRAIWKTGVEMEALTAASVAALTIYDMLKPIDKNMEIVFTKLLEKTGGKSDFIEKIPEGFRAAVVVTSDGTYTKKREDKSGKLIKTILSEMGITDVSYQILPDEQEMIREKILDYCQQKIDLIITTGGTGLGPRDVTVEATARVIERQIPAVMTAIQTYGQRRTPYAMLSRGLAGIRDKSLIINLPGSSKGAEEGMRAVFPSVLHVYKMMKGGGH